MKSPRLAAVFAAACLSLTATAACAHHNQDPDRLEQLDKKGLVKRK